MLNCAGMKQHSQSSLCPIAKTLELLGDHWTLLVLRDLFVGKTRFSEFLDSPEAIATSVLTRRLKKLEESGLVARRRYQQGPDRYEYHLSEAGVDTLTILQALAGWACRHLEPVWQPPAGFLELTPESWRSWREARATG